jgi:predicted O-methyltransferase YrrM
VKTLFTIIKNIIITKSYKIILYKILYRIYDKQGSLSKKKNLEWIQNNSKSSANFLKEINTSQYQSSLNAYKSFLKNKSFIFSENQKRKIGGGGMYVLLNFLVSFFKPKNIIETGVAAGVSSHAILKALENNKIGHLYSSDLPIMRLENPFNIVGALVNEKLKINWSLYLKGDLENLKIIKSKINKIDLIHYDSGKRYYERENVFNYLDKFISQNTIIIMDDIQDNSFFYDYLLKKKIKNYKIFEYEKKYVGLILNYV